MNKNREGIEWGLMTESEQNQLRNAYKDGKHFQYWTGNIWADVFMSEMGWSDSHAYRIKPEDKPEPENEGMSGATRKMIERLKAKEARNDNKK